MEDDISLWQAMAGRRSIRRFTSDPVDEADLNRMLAAACQAPNGWNRQPWRFVVVKKRDVLRLMAEAVESAADRLAEEARSRGLHRQAEEVAGRKKSWTFFLRAPLLVAVFERSEWPDARVDILRAMGLSAEEIHRFRPRSTLQSVAGAIQNLLLAAHALGYGACWMTSPLMAAPKLEEIIGVREGYRLVAVVPIGRPAESPSRRPRKPLEEVVTVI